MQYHFISGETNIFCTNRLESRVLNFTVFSRFDRKSTDFDKNEGEMSIFIQSKLKS